LDKKKKPQSFVRKRRPEDVEVSREPSAESPPPAPETPRTPAKQQPRRDEAARVVVPRHERGEHSPLDIELREVRYGATARQAYLRVVPKQRRFTRVASGHIEATQLASRPQKGLERVLASARSVVLGSPLSASQAIHERLTKVKALAVLGSDPLSSSAYATEEALIVLALAGSAALIYSLPIAAAVTILMIVVVASYRQTQKAYPSGGGAYIVAHENLGWMPGLIAAGALIVDYVLLVSVSVAAGVAAITSAVPELLDWKVPLSVMIIIFFTLGNLRGIRESGTIFSAPTYFFIFAMGSVIALGLVKVAIGDAPGSILHSAPPKEEIIATHGLGLWLVLRAFSSGGAALTGVEAMSNNIPNFKPPESDNARTTLTIMAAIAIYLFVGITFLASRYGLVPSHEETIVSQLGREVLGDNALYFAYQASTAMVLFLAANTSFYDFPLLSAILARDRYMPRQFAFRGDRLAYTNGILVLSGSAVVLLVVFNAEVTRLIPLYAVGVFVSFTLSQSGMVVHWLKLKEPGWRGSLILNGVGAVVTGVVAVIIGATKFAGGAWISMLLMGAIVILFWMIARHYRWFARQIEVPEDEMPAGVPIATSTVTGAPREHVIVPIDGVNRISLGAVAMAREVSALVTAVHLTDDREAAEQFRERWEKVAPDVPLIIIESPYRAFVAPMIAFIEHLEGTEPDKKLTIILPRVKERHWWESFLHNRDALRLRPLLREHPGVNVVDFPFDIEAGQAAEPAA
jgi:amino acid transporter